MKGKMEDKNLFQTHERLKEKMREIFKRSEELEMKIENSRVILSGWWNYFSLQEKRLTQLDSFIRKRVRINAWSQWKRIRTMV